MTIHTPPQSMSMATLTPDQQHAADTIFKFLLSPEKELVITGPAGTGKTTLLRHTIHTLLKEYENSCKLLGMKPIEYKVALTATTNKAVEVLSTATNRHCQTIHSFLNLRVSNNFESGRTNLTPSIKWSVHQNTILFIDEASMIDQALYAYINKGTANTCKIIYLGDRCQLAPVFEKISPVFLNEKYLVSLETPIRNAGQPALMALCDQLRANVDSLEFQPIKLTPGVVDFMEPGAAEAYVQQAFKEEDPSNRILCFTNKRVKEYNDYIRKLRGNPDHLVAGEVVVAASSVVTEQFRIYADEEYTIDEISPQLEIISCFGAEIECFRAKISNKRTKLIVPIPTDPDFLKALMRAKAREKAWRDYYWLEENFPEFRPKDSTTVYKAQGSTHHSIVLDLGNIGTCKDKDQIARMLYVGASRATDRLILFGSLPEGRFPNFAIEA